ncbi:hypothetical protein APT_10043 (plasmid) [Acetobacter pasteurianus NBRC 101655]|uniref:Uncharacterized protein n=1 Tax=Acetobacter oryzifermentans TaxID=1633874 RepID=A0ABM6ANF7_9PROT|nr:MULTISPECIES: hypothetical protein [Acetobacter]ANA15310.1 hypothetical protein WG31_14385 [Acetobacter oryzifermentans]BAU39787.1 hypothetical protein APT_10043 [Acetobacter pasteurianus NBRC 101655]CCT60939.1 hypothetical protein APA386B_1P164 [Acetobacter pasteurianus 386B]
MSIQDRSDLSESTSYGRSVLLGTLDAIERAIDPRPGIGRKQALLLLGVRDRVIDAQKRYEDDISSPMDHKELARQIHKLSKRLVA